MFPQYIQLRQPEKIFSTHDDGYNINNLYNNCEKFIESRDIDCEYESGLSQYYSTLFLIKTKNKEIFGAFITAYPALGVKGRFQGTPDSFVFFFDPDGDVQENRASELDLSKS